MTNFLALIIIFQGQKKNYHHQNEQEQKEVSDIRIGTEC